jgi:hypothetical protein
MGMCILGMEDEELAEFLVRCLSEGELEVEHESYGEAARGGPSNLIYNGRSS